MNECLFYNFIWKRGTVYRLFIFKLLLNHRNNFLLGVALCLYSGNFSFLSFVFISPWIFNFCIKRSQKKKKNKYLKLSLVLYHPLALIFSTLTSSFIIFWLFIQFFYVFIFFRSLGNYSLHLSRLILFSDTIFVSYVRMKIFLENSKT